MHRDLYFKRDLNLKVLLKLEISHKIHKGYVILSEKEISHVWLCCGEEAGIKNARI